jgi:hypothetical protein
VKERNTQKPLIRKFFKDIYKINLKPHFTPINYALYTLFSTPLYASTYQVKSLPFSYTFLFKAYLIKRFLYLLL